MHIDLDAKLRELERRAKPATLTLRGRTYTFLPEIPPEAALKLGAAPERDEHPGKWRQAVIDFVAAVMVDEDQADWLAATADPAEFPDELVDETITGLAEEYLARPTSPSTALRAGRVNDGDSSSSQPSEKGSATSAA